MKNPRFGVLLFLALLLTVVTFAGPAMEGEDGVCATGKLKCPGSARNLLQIITLP